MRGFPGSEALKLLSTIFYFFYFFLNTNSHSKNKKQKTKNKKKQQSNNIRPEMGKYSLLV